MKPPHIVLILSSLLLLGLASLPVPSPETDTGTAAASSAVDPDPPTSLSPSLAAPSHEPRPLTDPSLQSGDPSATRTLEISAAGSPSRSSVLRPSLHSKSLQRVERRLQRREENLVIETRADGSRRVRLQGGFMHVSALVPGPNGETRIQCFSDFEALQSAANPSADRDVPLSTDF